MSGRSGSSGHQNLIKYASKKLLDEIIGDDYLSLTLVREQPMDVEADVSIRGVGRLRDTRITDTKQRLYADIACAAVFDMDARHYYGNDPLSEETLEAALKMKEKGDLEEYRNMLKDAYGVMYYVIECEINPRSNLLRDGPRLTAYKLIKEKNPNFMLILAVFEGTEVDNPDLFDAVWEFPHAT